MRTVQWGIIGCGDVTEVKSGPAFSKVPHSKLVAVMRRNAVKAEDYAQRHNVPKWYTDAEALINDPNVNAVYVATPPLQHEEYTVQALRAGKPVYVEKPMAIDAAAAERILEAAKETGVKLSVAHYRRKLPLFLKVKSLLEQKVIGDVRLVHLQLWQPHKSSAIAQTEENWRIRPAVSGGGYFYDLAPHQLDLMLYFFGRVKEANGLSFNAAGWYEADDAVGGQMIFESGVLFSGSWCFTVNEAERRDLCEIVGSEGSIRFPVFDYKQILVRKNGTEDIFSFNPLPHVQQPMIESVVRYFLDEAPNPCSAKDGVEVMRLMEAFTKQSK